jgi:IS4 transposase
MIESFGGEAYSLYSSRWNMVNLFFKNKFYFLISIIIINVIIFEYLQAEVVIVLLVLLNQYLKLGYIQILFLFSFSNPLDS